jgi:hypothetical protein
MREGTVSRNLFWLTDEQWAKIAPLLPTDVRGKARVDDRRVISGILHVLKSGLSARVRPSDNDLQSLRALGETRSVGKDVRRIVTPGPLVRDANDRLHTH